MPTDWRGRRGGSIHQRSKLLQQDREGRRCQIRPRPRHTVSHLAGSLPGRQPCFAISGCTSNPITSPCGCAERGHFCRSTPQGEMPAAEGLKMVAWERSLPVRAQAALQQMQFPFSLIVQYPAAESCHPLDCDAFFAWDRWTNKLPTLIFGTCGQETRSFRPGGSRRPQSKRVGAGEAQT
jgi:hypothetical protein